MIFSLREPAFPVQSASSFRSFIVFLFSDLKMIEHNFNGMHQRQINQLNQQQMEQLRQQIHQQQLQELAAHQQEHQMAQQLSDGSNQTGKRRRIRKQKNGENSKSEATDSADADKGKKGKKIMEDNVSIEEALKALTLTAEGACSAVKTPVSVLQELLSRRGITPTYDLVQIEGAIHEPTFRYRVTFGTKDGNHFETIKLPSDGM